MEVRSQEGEHARVRLSEASKDLLRANQERLQELRQRLADLTESRGERARDARQDVAARMEGVRTRDEVRPGEARDAERPARGVDRLEISDRARALARGERAEARREPERAERLAELRERYLSGDLNTPERIERAAARLLRDEPDRAE